MAFGKKKAAPQETSADFAAEVSVPDIIELRTEPVVVDAPATESIPVSEDTGKKDKKDKKAKKEKKHVEPEYTPDMTRKERKKAKKKAKRKEKGFLRRVRNFIIWLIVIVIVVLGGFGAYMRFVKNKDFYNNAQAEFVLPGLTKGFVPQGLDYVDGNTTWLISGDSNKADEPSPIYVSTGKTFIGSKLKFNCITVELPDGSLYMGDGNGIATDGTRVYLTGDKCLIVLKYTDVALAASGSTVKAQELYPLDFQPGYVTCHEGYLFTGECYIKGNADTDKTHHLSAPDGKVNASLMYVYNTEDCVSAETFGKASPVLIVSTPNQVQGISFDDAGHMILSTSKGLASSKLYYYDFDIAVLQKIEGGDEEPADKADKADEAKTDGDKVDGAKTDGDKTADEGEGTVEATTPTEPKIATDPNAKSGDSDKADGDKTADKADGNKVDGDEGEKVEGTDNTEGTDTEAIEPDPDPDPEVIEPDPNDAVKIPTDTFKLGGKDIPLLFLCTENLAKTYSAAPMAEEIEFIDGRVYINCDAAASNHLFGWLYGAARLFSFNPSATVSVE